MPQISQSSQFTEIINIFTCLNAAFGALEDENENNDAAAVNTLEAFINAVEAQRGKKIPEAEADALIAAAQEIIEQLSIE